jgi:hypothetical protein
MPNVDRYLPDGHPLIGHPGHALLYDAYLSIDVRRVDDALAKLGDAMRSFGWDLLPRRFDECEPRRCWRHWVGLAAQVRVQTFDYVACGPLAHTTTDQALLNELEELYVEATNARRAEIESKRRARRRPAR